jgi:hypothetical protein
MGSYGEDWLEMQNRDHQQSGVNRVDGYSDFMLSSRISYEMGLKGPWYVHLRVPAYLCLLPSLV